MDTPIRSKMTGPIDPKISLENLEQVLILLGGE